MEYQVEKVYYVIQEGVRRLQLVKGLYDVGKRAEARAAAGLLHFQVDRILRALEEELVGQ